MPSSVHEFEASLVSASRISGGAAAEPRLYDEFASNGMPNSVGAPQGNFPFAGLDMDTPQAPITLHLSEHSVQQAGDPTALWQGTSKPRRPAKTKRRQS